MLFNKNALIVLVKIIAIVSCVEYLYMLISAKVETLFLFDPGVVAGINVLVLNLFSAPLIYLLVIRPFIIERDNAYNRINQLSLLDPLTQTLNRRGLETNFNAQNKPDTPSYAALILLDLDGFKKINDINGHQYGDEILIETSRRLKHITRENDTVCRMGGDEFVLIFNNISPDVELAKNRIETICEKILDTVQNPIKHNGLLLKVGASIGVDIFPQKDCDLKTILSRADKAMYNVKNSGKGDYKIHSYN